MKPLTAALITVLLRLPPWYEDVEREPPDQREHRAVVLAVSITTSTETQTGVNPVTLAALEVTQGFWESRFALHVHQDKCRIKIGECDAGRAKSVWQLQATGLVPRDVWVRIGGTDLASTTLAARGAARVLTTGLQKCGDIEGAISMYATGSLCRWKGAPERVRFYRKIRQQLVTELRKPPS